LLARKRHRSQPGGAFALSKPILRGRPDGLSLEGILPVNWAATILRERQRREPIDLCEQVDVLWMELEDHVPRTLPTTPPRGASRRSHARARFLARELQLACDPGDELVGRHPIGATVMVTLFFGRAGSCASRSNASSRQPVRGPAGRPGSSAPPPWSPAIPVRSPTRRRNTSYCIATSAEEFAASGVPKHPSDL